MSRALRIREGGTPSGCGPVATHRRLTGQTITVDGGPTGSIPALSDRSHRRFARRPLSGGAITLLDPRGSTVHGMSHTAEQARDEGWTPVS